MGPLSLDSVETFGLLLVRCVSFYAAGPIFAHRSIPAQVKLLLGAVTAIALYPVLPPAAPQAADLLSFAFSVAAETLLGILLAFAAVLPFEGIRMAAGLVDIQIGFGIVQVIDPRGESQVSILARLYDVLAVTLFLLLNGHHLLLRALGMSLRVVPLGEASVGAGVVGQLIGMAGSMFVTALAIGGPLIAVLFLTDAAMGFVARTVPQMNIFIVGFPVKIGVGLLGVALTLPFFTRTLEHLISGIERDLLTLLAGM